MPSILCLLVVWLGVALAVRAMRSGKPSAASTLALLKTNPGPAQNAALRRAWIELLASHLSGLDLNSRHRVLMDPALRAAFLQMPAEDQSYFLQTTAPPGMREFIEGSKQWRMNRYERLIPPALADLEEQQPGSSARLSALLTRPADDAIWKSGIEAFLKDADARTRFDTRPVFERVQRFSQMGR